MTEMKVNKKEVARYLGYKESEPERDVYLMIDTCLNELRRAATPRYVRRDVLIAIDEETHTVKLDDLEIPSVTLTAHLRGCEKGVMFAATLGAEVDRLMQRCGRTDIGRAVVMQACAAAMVEAVCDNVEELLTLRARDEGLYIRPRYSPGYGDFDIERQADFLNMLDGARRIGLTMTDAYILTPTKSVTAVIGLSHSDEGCHVDKCAACPNKDCTMRHAPHQEEQPPQEVVEAHPQEAEE